MRLTLRTLLAYLDDTLEASAAREVGSRISASPFAQEMVRKIQEAVHSRRIGAPPEDPTQAILSAEFVAAYLDNGLPPEGVQRAEKVMLESDLYLAEAASCHQILTLNLSTPAPVPAADLNHFKLMGEPRASARLDEPREELEAAQAAVRDLGKARLQVFPRLAVGLMLVVLVILLATVLLNPRLPVPDAERRPWRPSAVPAVEPVPEAAASAPSVAPASQVEAVRPSPAVAIPSPGPATTPPAPVPIPAAPATVPVASRPEAPPAEPVAGPLATFDATEGLLAVFVPAEDEWHPLPPGPIGQGAHVMHVSGRPVRLSAFNGLELTMQGRCEVIFVAGLQDQSLELELADGVLQVQARTPGPTLRNHLAEGLLTVEFTVPNTSVRLERVYDWPEGVDLTPASAEEGARFDVVKHRLTVWVDRGGVRLRMEGSRHEVAGPAAWTWASPEGLRPIPWTPAAEPAESGLSRQRRAEAFRRLAKMMAPKRSVGLSLLEACSHPNVLVREMAGRALPRVSQADRLFSLLKDEDRDRIVLEGVLEELRPYFARHPERWLPFWAAAAEWMRATDLEIQGLRRLITGLTAAQKADPLTQAELTGLRSYRARWVRELADRQLKALTAKKAP